MVWKVTPKKSITLQCSGKLRPKIRQDSYCQIWSCVDIRSICSLTIQYTIHKMCVPITGPVVAQRVGRGIALLFHDHGTRMEWMVSSTPRPYFTPGKNPVPIVLEAGWAPGPVWTGGKSRPTWIRSPDLPARSHSLYRLNYPAHIQYIAVL